MVLVTGFGAFGDVVDNPSERIAVSVDGTEIASCRVVGTVLPVSYRRAVRALDAALGAHRPAAVVALGAGRGEAIRIEGHATPGSTSEALDNDGERVDAYQLAGVAAEVRRCALPVEALASQLDAACLGRSVVASDDAGGYVCNAVFFTLLARLPKRAAFVHLPRDTSPAGLRAANQVVTGLISAMVAS